MGSGFAAGDHFLSLRTKWSDSMLRAMRALLGLGTTKTSVRKATRNLPRAFRGFETLEERTVPTVLGLGDLAFTGYQATAPDKVSFVLLKDVDNGTILTVTDNAWTGSALATTEGNSVITFGGNFSAGTQFNYDATRVTGQKWAVGTTLTALSDTTGGNFALNASGDNLFAYNGATAPTTGNSPLWISAFATNAFLTSGTSSASLTYLPAAFTAGDTAFSLGIAAVASNENGAATSPSSVSGAAVTIRSTVYTLNNWTTFTAAGAQAIPPNITFTFSSNQAPTDLALSSASIAENNAVNATIGVFTTTDPDSGNTFTYSLVSGAGSADNGSFNISGNALRATDSFDFETKNTYSIRVRTTDQGGLSFEKTIAINVTDVFELPNVLLNEIKANPPGNTAEGNKYQYIELRGEPGAPLDNVYVVMLDGNGGNVGIATYVIGLTGQSLGSNGLLMIKSPTAGHTAAADTAVVTDAKFDSVSGGVLSKQTVSFYLAYATGAFVEGSDYDTNDIGILDQLPAGFAILDNVGWSDGDSGDVVYGGVVLTQNQGTPDAATRIVGTTATSAAAWYNGDLDDTGNDPAQMLYDATRRSTNLPLAPVVASITPGEVNFTEPPVIATNLVLMLSAGTQANVIGETNLLALDAEQTADQLTFTVTSLPAFGTLKYNGSAVMANVTTFTQADLAASLLTYDAPASPGSYSFQFSVSDGTHSTSGAFALLVNGATDTGLRIVSYNITASADLGSPRTGYETILRALSDESYNGVSQQVDLFVLQEVKSQATTSQFIVSALNSIYGSGVYARGSVDGYTSGAGTQGVVYNSQTLSLLEEAVVGLPDTPSRQTLRYKFQPIGGGLASTFYVYNSHLKASDGANDLAQRANEVQVIRANADSLGQGANIIYAGDFNLYASSEAAYQNFLASGNGQAFDPINRPGNWHNTSSFKDVFTQAPANAPPGGLTGGGLDDRFDFQLVSGELTDGNGLEYLANSYHAFGNNGSVAMNGNINAASSTALAGLSNRTTILNLLTTVSDHLPVVADFTFAPTSANTAPEISLNTGLTVTTGTTGNVIGDARLKAIDGQQGATNLTFTVTQLPSAGVLKYNGSAVAANTTTFTQADISEGKLTYDAAASAGIVSFGFQVSDGALSAIGTFALTVASTFGLGDIAFTGYQSATPDKVSFVLLRDVGKGMQLTVSDNAWNGTALLATEGTSVITFGAAFAAGTQLNFDASRTSGVRWAVGSATAGLSDVTGNFALNTSGDNLFAYNGNAAPTTGNDSNWVAAFATNAFVAAGAQTTSLTALPVAFTVGDTAFSLGLANNASNQNGVQTAPASVSGSPSQIRTAIATVGNWSTFTTAGARAIPPIITFSVASVGNNPPTEISLSNLLIAENNSANAPVGTFATADADTVDSFTYALVPGIGGDDNGSFLITNVGGVGILQANAVFNQEIKSSYLIRVRTTDSMSNTFEEVFTIAINNLDEVAPTITSGGTTTAINENSGAGQVVYTATSTDTTDYVSGLTTYGLKPATGDFAEFSINGSTGAVTLTGNPDYETKPNYSFTVVATDAAGNFREKAVSLAINNVDEVAPTITSDSTATAINENSGAGQVVYIVTSTDATDYVSNSTTYSLKPATGDVAAFSIVGGAVTLTGDPDFETKSSYSFTVVATDAAGNFTEQAVTLAINDLPETPANQAPTIAAQTFVINSKSLLNAKVGAVVAADADVGQTLSYAITSGNANGAFAINAVTGVITVADASKLPKIVKPATTVNVALSVTVTDNGTPAASNSNTVTVTLDNTGIEMSPTVAASTFTIAENNKSLATVGKVVPTAAYTGQKFSFSGLTGADFASFEIDSKGVIKVKPGTTLDFETKASYSFQVVVADSLDALKTTTANVTVNVKNLNEIAVYTLVDGVNAPVAIDKGKASITIAEAVPGGTTVNGLKIATLSAADQDQLAASLHYQLAGVKPVIFDKTGAFAYDSATGEITVADASKISFEKYKKFTLNFAVTDDPIAGDVKSKALTAKLALTVNVTDINEAAVITSVDTFSIAENNKAGATVGTVKAKDADKTKQIVTYSIVSVDGVLGTGIFAIDGAKGKITVPTANALNFEAKPTYTLVVRASDGLLNTDQTVTVNVTDVNEAATSVLKDALGATVSNNNLTISKAAVINGDVIGTMTISDVDAGLLGQVTNVTFTEGSKGALTVTYNATLLVWEIKVLDKTKLAVTGTKPYGVVLTVKDGSAKPLAAKLPTVLVNVLLAIRIS
jgi:endonuclease/exonuclease/phosphatase family metal-dependent hydrolase